MDEISLDARLAELEELEGELPRDCHAVFSGGDMYYADWFVLGALRRILAQSRGFRLLISSRNFPCAAALVRLQIDTAMRINGLFLMADPEVACRALFNGAKFDRLKDRDGKQMRDAHLRAKLAQDHAWIDEVYRQTSDFIHLSSRHFFTAVSELNETDRTVRFAIGPNDPDRPESSYYETVECFTQATHIAGGLALAYFEARPTAAADGNVN